MSESLLTLLWGVYLAVLTLLWGVYLAVQLLGGFLFYIVHFEEPFLQVQLCFMFPPTVNEGSSFSASSRNTLFYTYFLRFLFISIVMDTLVNCISLWL